MRAESIDLRVADGTTMQAHVARPEGAGPHAGILLLQEAYGVNAHIKDVAGRFAPSGYVTIAPELFHPTAPPRLEGAYRNLAAAPPPFQAITVPGLEADVPAAPALLRVHRKTQPRRPPAG